MSQEISFIILFGILFNIISSSILYQKCIFIEFISHVLLVQSMELRWWMYKSLLLKTVLSKESNLNWTRSQMQWLPKVVFMIPTSWAFIHLILYKLQDAHSVIIHKWQHNYSSYRATLTISESTFTNINTSAYTEEASISVYTKNVETTCHLIIIMMNCEKLASLHIQL